MNREQFARKLAQCFTESIDVDLFWSTNSGHIFKHQFMINWRPSAVG